MRRVVATAFVLGGLWLVTFPFVSVWQSTSTALETLPVLEGQQATDDRNWDAIFSPGFTVATRLDKGTGPDQYRQALVASGFESTSLAGERWWVKECCGDYDSVQVRVAESGAGGSLVTVSLQDNDVQVTWPFVSGLGLLTVLVALGVYGRGSDQRSSDLVAAR